MLPQTTSATSSFSRLQTLALCTGVIAIPLLLGLAGEKMRAITGPAPTLQSFDASRQMLYVAQADGSVRVLNLRNTVGEIGALRSAERREVRAMKLQANGHELWLRGDDADYRYDAHSLRLIAREASVAQTLAMSAPAAGPLQR